MDKLKIKQLFSGLCCSNCKSDFDDDSIFIQREEKDLTVVKIICAKCGKNFGLALIGDNPFDVKDIQDDEFVIQDCPLPISYDDVIDAHKFINKLDNDWNKYIPDDLKKL